MSVTLPFLAETRSHCQLRACGLTLDISRQRLTDKDWLNLLKLAQHRDVIGAQERMVHGEIVNASERRQALHTSLRSRDNTAPGYSEVQQSLKKMYEFARAVRLGLWTGATGKRITDVVNIGIGGSEKGPHAVYHALRDVKPAIRLHFLSTVDGVLLDRILGTINPEQTLLVVSSKSFSTRETMVNAQAAIGWLKQAGIHAEEDLAKHVVLCTAKQDAHKMLDLPEQNQFDFWSWVGGRFSVWGTVGLPLVIALGPEVFQEFLDGAYEMDCHMLQAPLDENMPLALALLSYWDSTRLGIRSHCWLPYDERLRELVPWLQQLEMESLGKNTSPDGKPLETPSGQAVWGGNGNESQHSFYQWLRAGSGKTSMDLVWCLEPGHRHAYHHGVLTANAKAQAEALVKRENESEQYFNAVSTLTLDAFNAKTLGSLMALYEHKTTMLATLYDINAFDQPGVELGKRLCREVEAQMRQRDGKECQNGF